MALVSFLACETSTFLTEILQKVSKSRSVPQFDLCLTITSISLYLHTSHDCSLSRYLKENSQMKKLR